MTLLIILSHTFSHTYTHTHICSCTYTHSLTLSITSKAPTSNNPQKKCIYSKPNKSFCTNLIE